ATSRLVIAKRVVASIVATYFNQINFGLMTFSQSGYFPYYPVTDEATIASPTVTRFMDRNVLKSYDCWDKLTGPTASCTISGQVFTRRASPNSKYRIKTG